MKPKYTEQGIDKYLSYLGSYKAHLDEVGASFPNYYDFELEHKLVEQCEAGGILFIADIPPRELE
jgi:hypothetical protein